MPELKSSQRRICLFGGTFDPIHCAHLRVAEEAVRAFSLDRILFVPAANPPHKMAYRLTPYEYRLRMVEVACRPFPMFEASRVEEGGGPSYTVDTVRRMRESLTGNDELFFLIGADAFNEIKSWKEWERLIEMITFIVVTRPGGHYNVPEGASVLPLNELELPISSSSIRARLAERKPTPELPVEVREYIDLHNLYSSGEELTVWS